MADVRRCGVQDGRQEHEREGEEGPLGEGPDVDDCVSQSGDVSDSLGKWPVSTTASAISAMITRSTKVNVRRTMSFFQTGRASSTSQITLAAGMNAPT
jgi:hypothetical protein